MTARAILSPTVMLHAFLNLTKPRGLTSHDVVAKARRMVGQRRVGHAGTLDPMAEGVLPVALGRATRLADRVGEGDKTYYARLHLGVATSTDDAEGEVVRRAPVPPLAQSDLEVVLDRFRGEIEQVPPAFSAVKIRGQRAYRAARRGEAVALTPRRVTIYELRLLGWASPLATLLVRCSRGTYIRSLARDIGQVLGVGGHLEALVRVAVGPFHLRWALGLNELADLAARGQLERALLSPDIALLDLSAAVVADARRADFRYGRPWPAAELAPMLGTRKHEPAKPLTLGQSKGETSPVRAYSADGQLLGLMDYDSTDGRWHPRLALAD